MKSKITEITISFQACALISLMVRPSAGAVAVFAVASGLVAYLEWLTRSKVEGLKEVKLEVEAIKGQIGQLHGQIQRLF